MISKTLLTFAVAALSVAAQAQIALDRGSNAAYSDGWTVGDNGGTGFGAWTTASGDPTYGGSVGITSDGDLGGASFSLVSGGSTYSGANAIRPLSVAVSVGQEFSFDFKQSDLASPQGDGSFAIILLNAAGQELTSAFGYNYTQFGLTATYDTFVAASGANLDSGIDYRTANGLHVAFGVTSATTFSVGIGGIGVAPTYMGVGTFKNAGPVAGIKMFSYQGSAAAPLLVNNLKVQAVPEPSALAALGLGLAAALRRRRR